MPEAAAKSLWRVTKVALSLSANATWAASYAERLWRRCQIRGSSKECG